MRYSKDFIASVNQLSFADEYANIFGSKPPQGKMFCCFHTNTDTPAAKIYGNSMKCFSCQRTYRTFDLLRVHNPQRLQELASQLMAVTAPTMDFTSMRLHVVPYESLDLSKGITLQLLDSLIN